MSLPALLVGAAAAGFGLSGPWLPATSLSQRTTTPRSGRELLERTHDRYEGRWFRTLTFVQTTELRRPDGSDTTETWYEAVRALPRGARAPCLVSCFM